MGEFVNLKMGCLNVYAHAHIMDHFVKIIIFKYDKHILKLDKIIILRTQMINETKQENTSELNIDKLAKNYSKKTNSSEQLTNIKIDPMKDSLISSIRNSKENQIDFVNDRFPYSIVWTPLPFIT